MASPFKSYTAVSGTIIDSGKDLGLEIISEVIVSAIIIFNRSDIQRKAFIRLSDLENKPLSTIIETDLEPKETLFINIKLFLSDSQKLLVESDSNSCDFTISGVESLEE